MLLPERMCRMDCLVDKDFKDSLVSELHSEGVVEVEFLEDAFLGREAIGRDVPSHRVSIVSDMIVRAKRILNFMDSYEAKNGGFIEDLLNIEKAERLTTREFSFNELLDHSRGVLNPAEESFNEIQSRIDKLESRTAELDAVVEKYSPFTGLGLDSKYFLESPYLYTVVGSIPEENIDLLEQSLFGKFGKCFLLVKAPGVDESVIASISVLKDGSKVLEDVLRSSRFNKLPVDVSGKFDDVVGDAKLELEGIFQDRAVVEESAREFCMEYRSRLLVAAELLELEKQRCEIFTSCGSTESVTFMRFWTTMKNSGKVEEILGRRTKNNFAVKKKTEFDEAPIVFDNPAWLKPFEGLTKMFSPPKYNQIDPTILIAPTFILFFGFMMADFFYGMLFIGAAVLLDKRYGMYSPSVRDIAFILTCFGISTMLFGMLTGNYFGDFLGKYVLGKSPQEIALWKDPLYKANAITFLLLAVAVGVIQVFSGYFFGLLDKMRRGEIKQAVTEQLSWFIIAAGVVIYALTKYPPGNPLLGSSYAQAGGVVFLAGVVLLVYGSGLMAVMDLTGLVGRVMSYARLLALGLTTSGMALAFNMLSSLSLKIPFVGVLLALFVFTAGHLAILLINSLGSFVHSIRLHYVEFFGTFYSGGGVDFKPFKEERRYTLRGE